MKLKFPEACIPINAVVSAGLLITSAASAQNIYVANYGREAIDDFTPNGPVYVVNSGISFPEGLAFDNSGDLFVATQGFGYIEELKDAQGLPLTLFATVAGSPSGLAFNNSGDLFVTTYSSGDVYEITPTGSQSTFVTGLNHPGGIAFDSAGDLFVAASGNNTIYEYENNGGTLSTSGTPFGTGLTSPGGLAFNSTGDLFVTDYTVSTGDIAEITPNGTTSVFADVTDPSNIAIDTAGNLYVSGNNVVMEITPGGSESTVATGLSNPTGIAIQGILLPVPEPSGWVLSALGAVALLFRRKKV